MRSLPHLALSLSLCTHILPVSSLVVRQDQRDTSEQEQQRSYTWPDPQYDELEGVLYDGSRATFSRVVTGCGFVGDRNFNAEWIRLVYHDMSTHNSILGTGGLDGSIVFELDRPENVGAGMQATINALAGFSTKYLSRSDIYASALIFAVVACGGPVVPFRGGRIDAKHAGPPGVPQPQESLSVHEQRFRLQGFTKEEMIALVACGHTVGGVRNPDFPDIVAPPTDGSQFNFKFFDKTAQNGSTAFDHRVVTEYLDGTTANPLVVDKNDTLNSDKRIFASDGGKTLRSISTLESFHARCQTLLERMINTVPHNVKLTRLVEPLDYKVSRYGLSVKEDGLLMELSFRVASTTTNPSRTVSLSYKDTHGTTHGPIAAGSFPSTVGTYVTDRLGKVLTQYTFSVPLNQTESVSSFWFSVDEGDGKGSVDVKNGGDGYKVPQDEVLLVPAESTQVVSSAGGIGWDVVVATKGQATQVQLLSFDMCDAPLSNASYLASQHTINLMPIPDRTATAGGYTFWKASVPECSFVTFDLRAKFSGRTAAVVRATDGGEGGGEDRARWVVNDFITPSFWVFNQTERDVV